MFPNLYRPDEIFQNLEPAFRMATGSGIVSWEWREGIRSPVYPGFLAGIIWASRAFGVAGDGYLISITFVLSVVATATVAIGFLEGRRLCGTAGGVVIGLLCALWPDLLYFSPKPLAEIQAGNILIVGWYLGHRATVHFGTEQEPKYPKLLLLLSGFVLALAFVVRFHLALSILWAAMSICRLRVQDRWIPFLCGAVIPVILMGLADYFYWGSFYSSIFHNYYVNITQNISAEFGLQPWNWYISEIHSSIGIAFFPACTFFAVGCLTLPSAGLISIIIVVFHSLIGHKEMTFIYAAIPAAVLVSGVGIVKVIGVVGLIAPKIRPIYVTTSSCFLIVVAALVLSLNYNGRTRWTEGAGLIQAQRVASRFPELCGLGIRWPALIVAETGGDFTLGRSVPVYAFGTPTGVQRVSKAANFVIGDKDVTKGLPDFSVVQCWDRKHGQICLARRNVDTAICQPDPTLDVNSLPNFGRMATQFGADPP